MRTHPDPRVLLAAALALLATPPAWPGVPADLDAYVARVRREFRVPGISVAVVKDGEVVVAKGYGIRREGEPAPVDENTLFGIASNTKAFTCAALAILAEERELSWDDPVTRHLPEFQMRDPWVTREVTVRDLVTHRAGLGRGAGDLMWWPPTDFSRAEIVRGIRHLEPSSGFRSGYAYNNVMYVAAGEVVTRVAGLRWDDYVRRRILEPLGMDRTTTSVSPPGRAANVASPHLVVAGAVVPIAPMKFDNAAAAAGLSSSAADLARWVRMLLECAVAGESGAAGTCVLGAASIRQMWTGQTVQPTTRPKPIAVLEPRLAAYGLGFGLVDDRGRKVVSHTGGLPGYVSRVTLVPEERLGVVVLTNQEAGAAFHAVTHHVLDGFLGVPGTPVDWVDAFREVEEASAARAKETVRKDAAARHQGTRPSLDLTDYAGVYRDPWYGDVRASVEAGHLVLDLTRTEGMIADLEHWHHDTFVARWRGTFMSDDAPYDAYVTFGLGRDGNVEEVTLAPVSPAIDFSFDFQDLRLAPVPEEAAAARP